MNYLELLNRLHIALQPSVYLETRVESGDSLRLSRSRSVSIDPAPQLQPEDLIGKPWVKLYQQSSDDFFRIYTKEATLEGHRLDLTFIHGLNELSEVARALEHIEQWGHSGTIVVIDELSRAAEGIVPFLHRHRPDLEHHLVEVDENKILLVTRLNPEHSDMAWQTGVLNSSISIDELDSGYSIEDLGVQALPIQAESALRMLSVPQRPIEHAIESCGWTIGPNNWIPGGDSSTDTLRIVARDHVRGAHRVQLSLAALGMDGLQFRLQSTINGSEHERYVFLDITHPGALHHDLDTLRLSTAGQTGSYELDWEGTLAEDESLTAIGITPVDFQLRPVSFRTGMSLQLRQVNVYQVLWPRSQIRYAPERFPDQPLTPTCATGRRDAVIFAWWIPDHPAAHKVGEYFLHLLRYHHSDSKIFIGINHGSDPTWTRILRESGLDIEIAMARPEIQIASDVGGFLAGLEACWLFPEHFDLIWFGHTKGASKESYDEFVPIRYQHDRKFWSRRADVDHIFTDQKIGVFSHRYGLWDLTDANIPSRGASADVVALQRIYRDRCAPLGLTAWETVFVMRDCVVRTFCDSVGGDFFRTDPTEWGADCWWFEGGFPSIASMQGFEPFIELDTDGPGSSRNDLVLFNDPRQCNRLAMDELVRWRKNPYSFQPRGLPRGDDN